MADSKGHSADATRIAAHFGVADELARFRAILADPACADDAERDLIKAIPSWPKPEGNGATIAALCATGASEMASIISQELSDELARGR
jgi:hypothetical protein